MSQQRKLVLQRASGLHLRPASLFVQLAQQFRASVRLKIGGREVDGKSMIEVLTLAADKGAQIVLEVDGEDETEAVEALTSFLTDPVD